MITSRQTIDAIVTVIIRDPKDPAILAAEPTWNPKPVYGVIAKKIFPNIPSCARKQQPFRNGDSILARLL